MDGLDRAFQSINSGKVIKFPFSEEYSNLFTVKSERHYIFYIEEGSNKTPKIIAIRHEKMDIAKRLGQRMEKLKTHIN